MKIRRVATGHDASGRSVVASDVHIDAIGVKLLPGCEFHNLWASDEKPQIAIDGAPPPAPGYFPSGEGLRFLMFTIPPKSEQTRAPIDYPSAIAQANEKLPGFLERMERNAPGMHTTDTIDFDYVIEGEVTLELDDGKEVLLRAGDTVVQNGTRHRWRNESSRPVRVLACLIGARRA